MRLPKKMYSFQAGTQSWQEIAVILLSLLTGEGLKDGKWIRLFEEEFAKYIGIKHALSFGAGRMALFSILEALDIGERDEVILPAYTCIVVPNALLYRKIKPVYVDIDPGSLNINPLKIEDKITPRTRAILVQHSFGLPCELNEINKIAARHNLLVIEDACLALGAEYEGRKVGGIGQVGFFSLDNTKVISTEIGGMITTNDDRLAERLRKLQCEAPFFSRGQILRLLLQYVLTTITYHPGLYGIGRYINLLFFRSPLSFQLADEGLLEKPRDYAYPARLSNIQARVGLNQLKNIEKNLAHRRVLAGEYRKRLAPKAVTFVNEEKPGDSRHVYLRFTVLVEDPEWWRSKFGMIDYLGNWFDSVAHGRTENLEKVGYESGSCPIAEYTVKHNINFPTHMRIAEKNSILEKVEEKK